MYCSIDDCVKSVIGRGWCATHYQRWLKHGNPLVTKLERHGYRGSPTYKTWSSMRERCRNKKGYADRGITVCERWNIFTNFLEDMGERPLGRTLDRIDNDGNYEPGNCRWATPTKQAHNRRNNVWVTIGSDTKTLYDWCKRYDVARSTAWRKYRAGVPPELIFNSV